MRTLKEARKRLELMAREAEVREAAFEHRVREIVRSAIEEVYGPVPVTSPDPAKVCPTCDGKGYIDAALDETTVTQKPSNYHRTAK